MRGYFAQIIEIIKVGWKVLAILAALGGSLFVAGRKYENQEHLMQSILDETAHLRQKIQDDNKNLSDAYNTLNVAIANAHLWHVEHAAEDRAYHQRLDYIEQRVERLERLVEKRRDDQD